MSYTPFVSPFWNDFFLGAASQQQSLDPKPETSRSDGGETAQAAGS